MYMKYMASFNVEWKPLYQLTLQMPYWATFEADNIASHWNETIPNFHLCPRTADSFKMFVL